MAREADYICPMLYPSAFQVGIPGYPNPVLHAYPTVYLSLRRAEKRTALPPVHFRPWLQAFRDFAFGGKPFDARKILEQIAAARAFGSDGWMFWNPHHLHTTARLPGKEPSPANRALSADIAESPGNRVERTHTAAKTAPPQPPFSRHIPRPKPRARNRQFRGKGTLVHDPYPGKSWRSPVSDREGHTWSSGKNEGESLEDPQNLGKAPAGGADGAGKEMALPRGFEPLLPT